jgi:hypothetical protein
MRAIARSLLVLCLVFMGVVAHANTVIDNSADAINATGGWTAVGQTLTSPGGSFLSYSFFLAGPVPDITFYVCSGDVQNGCGVPLFTTSILGAGPGQVNVNGINAPTTLGNTYSVLMDLNGYGGSSVMWGAGMYAGGIGEWGYGTSVTQCCGDLDTGFIATFGSAAPEPGSLPLFGTGAIALAGIIRRKLTM